MCTAISYRHFSSTNWLLPIFRYLPDISEDVLYYWASTTPFSKCSHKNKMVSKYNKHFLSQFLKATSLLHFHVQRVMPLGRGPLSVTLTLTSIYYTHFHFIKKCEITWGGNSSNSMKIFTLKSKIIGIMSDVQPRTCCRSLLKNYRFCLFRADNAFINKLHYK